MPQAFDFGHIFIDPTDPESITDKVRAAVDAVLDEGGLRHREDSEAIAANLVVTVELLNK